MASTSNTFMSWRFKPSSYLTAASRACFIIGSFSAGHHQGIVALNPTASPPSFTTVKGPLPIMSGIRRRARPYLPRESRILPQLLPLLLTTEAPLWISWSGLESRREIMHLLLNMLLSYLGIESMGIQL